MANISVVNDSLMLELIMLGEKYWIYRTLESKQDMVDYYNKLRVIMKPYGLMAEPTFVFFKKDKKGTIEEVHIEFNTGSSKREYRITKGNIRGAT